MRLEARRLALRQRSDTSMAEDEEAELSAAVIRSASLGYSPTRHAVTAAITFTLFA